MNDLRIRDWKNYMKKQPNTPSAAYRVVQILQVEQTIGLHLPHI